MRIILIVALCSACLSSSQAKTGGEAAGSCAIGDIEKYGAEVAGDLLSLNFTQALDDLKAKNNLTQDVVNCVVAALVAAYAPAPAPAVHGEPSPIYVNGRAYLSKHASVDVIPAAWLASAERCESPNSEPAVDCLPFEAMKYDGCHWSCQ